MWRRSQSLRGFVACTHTSLFIKTGACALSIHAKSKYSKDTCRERNQRNQNDSQVPGLEIRSESREQEVRTMGSKRRGSPFRDSESEVGCGLWMAAFMTPALHLLFATGFTLRPAAPHGEGFSYRHSGNHNLQAAATNKIRVLCDQSEKFRSYCDPSFWVSDALLWPEARSVIEKRSI